MYPRCVIRWLCIVLLGLGCSSGGGGDSDEAGAVPDITEASIGEGGTSLQLSWQEATVREDGSPLESVRTYRIHYWYENASEQILDVGHSTSVLLLGLQLGVYMFAVTTVDSFGVESALSERATLEIG